MATNRSISQQQQSTAFKIRKANKPLMEKKRRERINRCLTELKQLVLEATRKSNTHYSKLEKADILELTVKYLRTVQRDQMTRAALVDPTVMTRYRLGFTECAAEVARYVTSDSPQNKLHPGDQVHNEQTGTRLVEHLSNCKMGIDAAATTGMLIAAEQQSNLIGQKSAEPAATTSTAHSSSSPSNEQLIATLAQCILQQKQQQFLSAFSLVTSPKRPTETLLSSPSSSSSSSSSPSSPVPTTTSSNSSIIAAITPRHQHSPLTPSPSSSSSSLNNEGPLSTLSSHPLHRNNHQLTTASGVWRPW